MFDAQIPPRAQELCAIIEGHLNEAESIIEGAANSADIFALRETQSRYLPETIAVYLAVPASMRDMPDGKGQTPNTRLIRSLETLERAARAHLLRAAAGRAASVETNQDFLRERFAESASSVPELPGHSALQPMTDADGGPHVPQSMPPVARPMNSPAAAGRTGPNIAPQVLLQRFFANLDRDGANDPGASLEAMGVRFMHVFPQFTSVKRALFRRTIEEVTISLPVGNGSVDYSVALRNGVLRATAGRTAHGIRVRTEETTLDHLLTALMEHLQEFAERDRNMKRQLERAFGGIR